MLEDIIVVKNHGPFAWGKSPANAVYTAVVLEKVVETVMKTLILTSKACILSMFWISIT